MHSTEMSLNIFQLRIHHKCETSIKNSVLLALPAAQQVFLPYNGTVL